MVALSEAGARRLDLGRGSPWWLTLAGLVISLGCTPETFYVEAPPTTSGPDASGPSRGDTQGPADSTATGADPDTTGGTGAACIPRSEAEDWWDPAWIRRRRIDIDTSVFSEALALSATLVNFPLLVRLPAADLGSTWGEREGADLRVRSGERDIALAYDLDQVDADGELSLWIKIPDITLRPEPRVVWLYYDNPGADAGEDASGVWAEFISVHHLGADLLDSAGSHHGTSSWEPELCDQECGPRIGAARRFVPERLHEVVLAGEHDYDLGHDPFTTTSRSFSVTLWMQSSSLTDPDYESGAMIAKGDDTWRIHTAGSSDNVALGLEREDGTCPEGYVFNPALGDCDYNLVATSPRDDGNVNDGAWHHIAAVFEGLVAEVPPMVQARIYVDGVELAVSPTLDLLLPQDDEPVRFGHNINAHRRWGGKLDEIRIMSGVRSPAQIAADYATVADDPTRVGQEQSLCP